MILQALRTLSDLRAEAQKKKEYRQLAIVAASNLGFRSPADEFERAMVYLGQLADETTEAGVMAEVNACRDLV